MPHHKNPERLIGQLVCMRFKMSPEERKANVAASTRCLEALNDKHISMNTFNGRRVHANLLSDRLLTLQKSRAVAGCDCAVAKASFLIFTEALE